MKSRNLLVFLPALLAMILLLSGCITAGNEFQYTAIPQIKAGETNIDDIKQIFGNPVRTGVEDGQLVWTYALYKANIFGSFEGRDLVVKFDNQNVVTSYNYSTTDRSEKLVLKR